MELPGERRRIQVPRERWKRALGERWPDDLASDDHLARLDVFAVTDGWRAGAKTTQDLVVAAMAWGYGPIGYGPGRTAAILDQDPDTARLSSVLSPLSEAQPTVAALGDAYEALRRRRPLWVRGLGPAFVTKLLYFAGYRRGTNCIQPLILDSVVAKRLPAAAGGASRRRGGWSTEEWLAYLSWAHREAGGAEPDGVEMELFGSPAQGSTSPRTRPISPVLEDRAAR